MVKISQDCCGGPAPENVNACCKLDANEKRKGKIGCGCSSAVNKPRSSHSTQAVLKKEALS